MNDEGLHYNATLGAGLARSVIRNCASGKRSPSMAMNGIEPPRPRSQGLDRKTRASCGP